MLPWGADDAEVQALRKQVQELTERVKKLEAGLEAATKLGQYPVMQIIYWYVVPVCVFAIGAGCAIFAVRTRRKRDKSADTQ